jgi:hypothetical protein
MSREVLLQRRPCALQRAVDGGHGEVEERRALCRRPAEHVSGDEDGPLLRRQKLDGGDERELDRLLVDDLGLRLGVGRRDPLQQLVGVRLEP